jgi:hypothetical protein
MSAERTRIDAAAALTARLPDGWWVERSERRNGLGDVRVTLSAFQEGGPVWKESGNPRSAIDVEVIADKERYGAPCPPEIHWPSTGDKRPVLAQAFAYMLCLAAVEAAALSCGEAGQLAEDES